MAAAGLRRMNGTRNREDVAALFDGQPRRNQGTAFWLRLPPPEPLENAGDQSIAPGKVCRHDGSPQGKLRNDCSHVSNFVRKIPVAGGIDPIDAGPDESDGLSLWRQAPHVGGCVDSQRQPTLAIDQFGSARTAANASAFESLRAGLRAPTIAMVGWFNSSSFPRT